MGEYADYALDEVLDAEEGRYLYRTGRMDIEEAFEKGIINEMGGEEE